VRGLTRELSLWSFLVLVLLYWGLLTLGINGGMGINGAILSL
jgi:nitrate reductase NapE component